MSTYYFEYDAANKILAVRFEAALTDDILCEYYAAAPAVIAPHEVRVGILDLTGLTSFDVSADTIRRLAARQPLIPDPIPRFIVAPSDVAFGMARMFQLSDRSREMLHIVRSIDEAYLKAGVTEPRFERLA